MSQSTVVIVGAGASSLSAAGALERRSIKSVILEEDEQLGGTWARRYDRLHLHTVRGFSGLAHYAIPRLTVAAGLLMFGMAPRDGTKIPRTNGGRARRGRADSR